MDNFFCRRRPARCFFESMSHAVHAKIVGYLTIRDATTTSLLYVVMICEVSATYLSLIVYQKDTSLSVRSFGLWKDRPGGAVGLGLDFVIGHDAVRALSTVGIAYARDFPLACSKPCTWLTTALGEVLEWPLRPISDEI